MNAYSYFCPKCGTEHIFEYEEYRPGFISGSPENCYESEGQIISGAERCKECDKKFDWLDIFEEIKDNS